MTLYDGSLDYHPCEYDFDALWSQFEEQKDVEEHAETSGSSLEISASRVSLVPLHVPKEGVVHASWSSTTHQQQPPQQHPRSSLSQHQQPSSFDESSVDTTTATSSPEEVSGASWSQFSDQRDSSDQHAETSRSSTEFSYSGYPQHPLPHHVPTEFVHASWPPVHTQQPISIHHFPKEYVAPWPLIPQQLPHSSYQQQQPPSLHRDEYSYVGGPAAVAPGPSSAPEILVRPRRRQQQQQPRRRLKRKAPKQELLDENVVLPTGFDRVLENASTNDNSNTAGDGGGNDDDFEIPRRRDCRRCETKVMLQSADGQLFNKYFEEEDIRDFARRFKTLRCEYGFSQADVGAALGRRYGSDFSQTTISRFEGLVLSHSNMCKLRPPVEQWLMDIQTAINNGIPLDNLRRACKNGDFWPSDDHQQLDVDTPINSNLVPPLRKRRKRTSLDASQRLALDSYFDVNQRPDNSQMVDIAKTLELDFEVVRVWFCNRRQKIRKDFPKIKSENVDDSDTASSSPIN